MAAGGDGKPPRPAGGLANEAEAQASDAAANPFQHGNSTPQNGEVSLSQQSSATQDSTDSSLPWVTGNAQCLRYETITDRESRVSVLFMKAVATVGDLGTLALMTVMSVRDAEDLIVMNRNFIITQVVSNAMLLLALLLGFVPWAARVASSLRHGKTWTKRRTGVAQVTAVRGALVLGIIAGQLAMNSHLLQHPGAFCRSFLLPMLDALIWTCWNCMLLTLVIEAHGTNLVLDPKRRTRHDTLVFDLPLSVHWPKLFFLWLPFTAVIVWAAIMAMEDGRTMHTRLNDGDSCAWGVRLECSITIAMQTASTVTYVCVGLYFFVYAAYLRRGYVQLRKEQYQKFRLPNLVLRFQMRFNGCMMLALFLGMTVTGLYYLIARKACITYATTWLGNPPICLIFVAMQLGAFYMSYPRRHDYLEARSTLPSVLLQQFAWTEDDVPRRRAAWKAALAPPPSAAQSSDSSDCDPKAGSAEHSSAAAEHSTGSVAPLFCFETAIKLFFWSVLVYAYEEEEGAADASLAAMPAPIREILGEMDAAMRLFGLRKRRLFYDRACGTKALLAWSDSAILLSFRGSTEMANFVQDAKVILTTHPPRRKFKGRTPRVHKGFLITWHAHSMHAAVLSLVRDLLAAAPNPGEVRILCTGHSLGGAVAQLASFDIVRVLGVAPEQISAYTFGCPRLGNRALAAEWAEVVPDTWHVINDLDVVTRGLKCFGIYKRAGQRVIIDRVGNIIVRPAHFEVSMRQGGFALTYRARGAADHATVNYQRALVAIITAQLQDSSRHADGLNGLLGLLKQLPQVRQALEAHARGLGTSFPALLRGVATGVLHAAAPGAALQPAEVDAPYSLSRHASLLRETGVVLEAGEGSPREAGQAERSDSMAREEEVVHVVFVDDAASDDRGTALPDEVVQRDVHP